jgi:hypothetical protein
VACSRENFTLLLLLLLKESQFATGRKEGNNFSR